MCLAIPMEIIEIKGNRAVAEIEGIRRTVGLELLDTVKEGDYVIIHAGFAIQVLDREDAEETLNLFRQMGDL